MVTIEYPQIPVDQLDVDDVVIIRDNNQFTQGKVTHVERIDRASVAHGWDDLGLHVHLVEHNKPINVSKDSVKIHLVDKATRTPRVDKDFLMYDGVDSFWHWVEIRGQQFVKKINDTQLYERSDRGKYGTHVWVSSKTAMTPVGFKRRYPYWSNNSHML